MLETTDFDTQDQMSPFLGATTHAMCGNENEPENTKLSSNYVKH